MPDAKDAKRNRTWLVFALCVSVFYVALIVWTTWFPPPPWTVAAKIMKDFQGNLVAGLIANLGFLVLAIQLDRKTADKIERIELLTERSEGVLQKREEQFEREQKIAQFEQFMKVESYHDVRFPNLKFWEDSLGLEYTIRPVRDGETGPRKKSSEMYSYWIVEVQGPAREAVLDEAHLAEYDQTPIKDHEFYYCSFFNDEWHMSEDGMRNWHAFYLSGKVGPCEYGSSANEFLGYAADPSGMQMLTQIPIVQDGTELNPKATAGCDLYKLFRNEAGSLFLKINTSPVRSVYLTNKRNTFGTEADHWFLKVEHMRGHATGQRLENIKEVIQRKLTEAKVDIPKIPWHRFPDHDY